MFAAPELSASVLAEEAYVFGSMSESNPLVLSPTHTLQVSLCQSVCEDFKSVSEFAQYAQRLNNGL